MTAVWRELSSQGNTEGLHTPSTWWFSVGIALGHCSVQNILQDNLSHLQNTFHHQSTYLHASFARSLHTLPYLTLSQPKPPWAISDRICNKFGKRILSYLAPKLGTVYRPKYDFSSTRNFKRRLKIQLSNDFYHPHVPSDCRRASDSVIMLTLCVL